MTLAKFHNTKKTCISIGKIDFTMSSNNLCQPIPGHPEAAVNKLAQVWNLMNLGSAKTLGCAKALAQKWYRQCSKNLLS